MTDETVQPTDRTTDEPTAEDARVQVLKAVVDRVTSWQDGATDETVRKELDDALADSDVEVDAETRDRIVARITGGGDHFDVTDVLR
jgi:hypothetical protein